MALKRSDVAITPTVSVVCCEQGVDFALTDGATSWRWSLSWAEARRFTKRHGRRIDVRAAARALARSIGQEEGGNG